MRITLSILILLTFSFCSRNKSSLPRLTVEEHDSVTSIDSKIMLRSQSPLLAVNFVDDTITIINFKDMEYYNNITNSAIDYSTKPNHEDIKVIIDTSYAFSNRGFIYKYIPELTEKERRIPMPNTADPVEMEKVLFSRYLKQTDSLKAKYLESYPVLIYNNSNYDLNFGLNPLKIIQEALDIDNKWKPIEFTYQAPGCGVGNSIVSYRVQPKHYLATAIIKYTGNYKTKIRINFLRGDKVIHSNEIIGYINRSQFNTRSAENFIFEKAKMSNPEWIKRDLDWMLHRPIKYSP